MRINDFAYRVTFNSSEFEVGDTHYNTIDYADKNKETIIKEVIEDDPNLHYFTGPHEYIDKAMIGYFIYEDEDYPTAILY